MRANKYSGVRINEVERYYWMIVYKCRHNLMPFKNDIRDVDEFLYIDVPNTLKRNQPLLQGLKESNNSFTRESLGVLDTPISHLRMKVAPSLSPTCVVVLMALS